MRVEIKVALRRQCEARGDIRLPLFDGCAHPRGGVDNPEHVGVDVLHLGRRDLLYGAAAALFGLVLGPRQRAAPIGVGQTLVLMAVATLEAHLPEARARGAAARVDRVVCGVAVALYVAVEVSTIRVRLAVLEVHLCACDLVRRPSARLAVCGDVRHTFFEVARYCAVRYTARTGLPHAPGNIMIKLKVSVSCPMPRLTPNSTWRHTLSKVSLVTTVSLTTVLIP